MKRIAAIAVIALSMAAPALAEEVLYCTDTDGNGFVWDEQGKAKRSGFDPARFTVKVISETVRMIRYPGHRYASMYSCRKLDGVLQCHLNANNVRDIGDPILFRGANYVRAFLRGKPVSDHSQIYLYYGTCAKF